MGKMMYKLYYKRYLNTIKSGYNATFTGVYNIHLKSHMTELNRIINKLTSHKVKVNKTKF